MDKLDRKILSVLQADSRASLQEIGAAVGLSPSPCWGRIKKMEEAGVITGYTVRMNPLALGLAETVLVMVTLDSHSDNTLEKFGQVLATIPEIVEAHLVSGNTTTCCASSSRTRATTSACCARSSTRSRAYATANPALYCARSNPPICRWTHSSAAGNPRHIRVNPPVICLRA